MPIWDSTVLTRFGNQGEDIFASLSKCIIDRVTVSTSASIAIYQLPSYVLDIRKVLWKGRILTPMTARMFRDMSPTLATTGIPDYYIFNNIGVQQIQFYPVPDETIAGITIDLFGAQIPNRVIVEHYRQPDYINVTIPSFIRRRFIKNYVMKMAFAMEGKGQNLKASKYYSNKWDMLLDRNSQLLDNLVMSVRKLICGDKGAAIRGSIPTPRLPINQFGISVDE